MDNIAQAINMLADFKMFIGLVLILTTLLSYIYTRKANAYSLKSEDRSTVGVFFRLSKIEILKLSVSYITLVYILSLCMTQSSLKAHHIMMYVMLMIVRLCLGITEKYSLIILINRVLQGIALLLVSFVLDYVNNIRYDGQFIVIYWVGVVVILLYSFYTFVGEVFEVSKGRKM